MNVIFIRISFGRCWSEWARLALGMCTGHSNEEKIFYILPPISLAGEPELWVCQVKNERLTGRSSKLSESTVSFLFQALQCKKTAVLHPTRCIKQIPDRVGLLTTYPLPDAPLADGEQLLSDIRSNCAIIGPEQLVALLSDNWHEKFVEFAYAGNEIGLATRQYLLAHREAIAFESRTTRSLDSFLSVLGCRPNTYYSKGYLTTVC